MDDGAGAGQSVIKGLKYSGDGISPILLVHLVFDYLKKNSFYMPFFSKIYLFLGHIFVFSIFVAVRVAHFYPILVSTPARSTFCLRLSSD